MRYRVTLMAADAVVQVSYIQASSASAARQALLAAGHVVVKVSAAPSWRAYEFPVANFTRGIASLMKAGLPLQEALLGMIEQEQQAEALQVLRNLADDIGSGYKLSTALGRQRSIFSPLYISLIEASESSGAVVQALERYLAYEETVEVIKKKIINASIYPALLVIVGMAVVSFLLLAVVPKFASIYADKGQQALPWSAQALVAWSQFAGNWGWLLIGMMLSGIAALLVLYSRAQLLPILVKAVGRIARVRRLMESYAKARWFQTMAMLTLGGYPFVHACELAQAVLLPKQKVLYQSLHDRVAQGQKPSAVMASLSLADAVDVRLLAAGEKSGTMPHMLEHLGTMHDQALSRQIEIFLRLVEPLLMLIVGGVVGLIIVMMYMPIFELMGNVT